MLITFLFGHVLGDLFFGKDALRQIQIPHQAPQLELIQLFVIVSVVCFKQVMNMIRIHQSQQKLVIVKVFIVLNFCSSQGVENGLPIFLFISFLNLTFRQFAVLVFIQFFEDFLEFLDVLDRNITLKLTGELLTYLIPLIVVKLVLILIQFDSLHIINELLEGLSR